MTPDWETAYDNRAAVAGAESLPAAWSAAAAAFREERGDRAATLRHGESARSVVDLFRPPGVALGLAVFVHGGYWMRNAPALFSHLAAGALARGWAVAMPGYDLCPDVRIADISRQVAAGVEAAAGVVPGPVRLSGHSAGGHLASRMICGGGLSPRVLDRVAGVLSISGLHDLRPLMRTPMQATLSLDLAEARAESPALQEPRTAAPVTAWVGGDELSELRRQSALLANVWTGCGLVTHLVEDAGHDHFSVISGLASADSPITEAWLGSR